MIGSRVYKYRTKVNEYLNPVPPVTKRYFALAGNRMQLANAGVNWVKILLSGECRYYFFASVTVTAMASV